jgi:hypothetical protein
MECPDKMTLITEAPGCQDCQDMQTAVIVFLPFLACGFLIFVLHETRRSPLLDGPLQVEIQGISGQVLMFLQILGACQAATISLGEPMTSYISALASPVELDALFDVTPCVSGAFSNPVMTFLAQMVMPAVFVCVLVIVFKIGVTIKKGLFCFDGLLNSIGEVLLEFYISITIAVFGPFDCYAHPNGKSSMVSRPDILCGEGDHSSMVIISIFAILAYPVNAMVVTILATWQHPRSMASNDIGHLIRCHFLFNRWGPRSYYFCCVGVTRNFLIACWPMVIPQENNDVALALMVITLLVPLIWASWNRPRRTPAMNKLDIWISFTQVAIMAIGAMSAYGDELRSGALSWGLMILVSTVFLLAGILALKAGLQLLTKGKSPGSWCFDIFIDHHGGTGAIGARSLQMVMSRLCRPRKVFYDYDEQLKSGSVGVICDACKLSQECVVVLSNETWCRSWSTAAILSAVLKNIPIQTVVLGGRGDASMQDMKVSEEGVAILAKQPPRDMLRPLGISDDNIAPGMTQVLAITPMIFDMSTQQTLDSFLTTLLKDLKVPLKPGYGREGKALSEATTEFFSKAKVSKKHESESRWYGTASDYVVICMDQGSSDALCASRVVCTELESVLHSAKAKAASTSKPKTTANNRNSYATSHEITSAEMDVLKDLHVIEDCDLSPTEFADIVKGKHAHSTVALFTAGSMRSVSQLLRLGYMRMHLSPFCPIPISIDDTFIFPGTKVLDDIENGSSLAEGFGGDAQKTALQYVPEFVPLKQARMALQDALQTRISFVDVPRLDSARAMKKLILVCFRIASEEAELVRCPMYDPAEADGGAGRELTKSDRASYRVDGPIPQMSGGNDEADALEACDFAESANAAPVNKMALSTR